MQCGIAVPNFGSTGNPRVLVELAVRAEWAGWDVSVVRAIYIVASVTTAAFPGILAYALLWLVLPESATVPAAAEEVVASESP